MFTKQLFSTGKDGELEKAKRRVYIVIANTYLVQEKTLFSVLMVCRNFSQHIICVKVSFF